MALITDKVVLNPKATGSLPSGSEGSLAYDSTVDALVSYGTAWQKVAKATAAGGTVTTYGAYKVHTFKADGTFSVSGGTMDIDILLIGGGGGGTGDNGGGGGSGGLVWKTAHQLSAGGYAIDVGAAGPGQAGGGTSGTGSDTTFATNLFIAKGGGYGGAYNTNGGAGGSGGGGGRNYGPGSSPGGTNQSGSGQAQGGSSIGYAGGAGHTQSTGPGGGGGGTGAVGVAAASGTVGNGGVGHSTFVGNATDTAALLWSAQAGTNSSNATVTGLGSNPGTIYIGGGGSGGTQDPGAHTGGRLGGLGGGANMGASAGVNGQTNTGSGGSGTNWGSGTGGDGGTGIVIIRYPA